MAVLPTKKQQLAISAFLKYKNILLTGGVRSGKTFGVLIGIPLLIRLHRDENCLLGAKTLSNVERNMLTPLRSIYGSQYVGQIKKGTTGELNVDIFGKKFWVITFNDEGSKDRLQGISLGLAILDEIALCPKSFYEMLRTRLDKEFSQLIATCNPDGPNHYIKTDLIDNEDIKSKFIQHWTLYDNREHLPSSVIEEFEQSFKRSPTFFRRMILGEWCSAEGLACFNFDRQKHYIPIEQLLKKCDDGESFVDKFCKTAHTLIYSIDPANANDMTGGVPILYNKNDEQLVLKRFGHDPKTSRQLSNIEQVKIIHQHINEIMSDQRIKIDPYIKKIMLIDCAGADMFIQCSYEFEPLGWNVIKMTQKDIKRTLEIMNNLMATNKCTIVNYGNEGIYDYTLQRFTYNDPLINELQSVRVKDQKTALTTRLGLNPEDPNDTFDAYRYNTAYYYKVEDVTDDGEVINNS